jgi:hypothetical protein
MPKLTRQLIAWMGLSFGLGFGLALVAEDLILQRHEEQLKFIAPKAHFVGGRTLERLKDGVAVPIDFNITLAVGGRQNVVERVLERFVVSYDLWEESYKVVRLSHRKSASNLSAPQIETWCFDNLGLPLARIPKDQPLFFRVEIRTAEAGNSKALFAGTDAFSDPMKALIAIFTAPPNRQQPHWLYEAGPFALADLKGM